MNYSWYSNSSDSNSPDNMHQILAYGSLQDILSTRKNVGQEQLAKIFLEHPKKVYTQASFNFIRKFVLGLDREIDSERYLKDAPRYTGQ